MAKKEQGPIDEAPIQRITFFDPKSIIVKGILPAKIAENLPAGYFTNLQNLRYTDGSLQTRLGSQMYNGALGLGTNPVFNGTWSGTLNGTNSLFVAIWVQGSGTVLYSINVTTFIYTEITGTSGANGNTRFTSNANVTFCTVRDPSGTQDLIVAQNGIEAARVYDNIAGTCAINSPIALPNPNGMAVGYTFANSTNVTGFSTLASSYIPIKSYTQTSAGIVTVTFTTPHGLSAGQYVVIVDPGSGIGGDQAINGEYLVITAPTNATITIGATVGTAVVSSQLPYASSRIGISGFYNSGVSGVLAPTIWTTPNIAAGDYCVVKLGAALPLSTLSSLVIAYAPNRSVANNLQIGVGSSSTIFTTIYDPTVPASYLQANNVPITNQYFDNQYAAVYSLGSLNPVDPNLACSYIKFAWVGSSFQLPELDYTEVQIGGVFNAQGIPGGFSYDLAWYNPISRSESPGYIPLVSQTQVSGVLNGAPFQYSSIPNSPVIPFTPVISALNVGTSLINQGVSQINVYRQDAGSTSGQYYYVFSQTVNTYGANGWSTNLAGLTTSFTDTIGIASEQPGRIGPGAYSINMPIGSSMVNTASRFFIGGVSTSHSQIYFSEALNQTRFATQEHFDSINVPDADSAGYAQISGEQIASLTLTGDDFVGVNPICVGTNNGTWEIVPTSVIQLTKPSPLSNAAAPFAQGVIRYLSGVYALDGESQLRRLGVGDLTQPITKLKTDVLLQAGNLNNCTLGINNDKLYIGYAGTTPGGGISTVNNSILGYELTPTVNNFFTDQPNFPNGNIARFVNVTINNKKQLWFFDNVANVYQYEAAGTTTDCGNPIQCKIQTLAVSNFMWGRVWSGRVGVVMDSIPSTITVTRTWKDNLAGIDGTINIARDTRSVAWMYEGTGSPIPPGGLGLSFSVGLAYTALSGTRMYALNVEAKNMGESGAISSDG